MTLLLATLACAPRDTVEQPAVVDGRVELPAPSADGLQFVSPDYEVPPFSERMLCAFDLYEGPTVGITHVDTWQNPDFGHHVVLFESNFDEDEYPPGTVVDCTESDDVTMVDMDPIHINSGVEEGHTWLDLPDGMAIKLREGTPVVMQSHFINYTEDILVLQDAINLEVVPEAEVSTWAAAFAHTETDLDLPPGGSTVSFDCEWREDLHVLYMLGHMHEWGTAFSVDWTHADGTERVYEIAEWDPAFRDVPPVNPYESGDFQVAAGDVFTTACTWDNTEDHHIVFPYEMCVTAGIVYPATVPVICEAD